MTFEFHNPTHLLFGAGLSVVNPAYMRFAVKERPECFAQFAQRIFGLLLTDKNDMSLAMEGIDKFEGFLRSIEQPFRRKQECKIVN
jgi:alcohol dehydrogenase YqhD (iron-dependent ADH family)